MKIEEKGGRLLVVDFDEIDAYKIACKVEKDGKLFYQKLYEKVDNEEIRQALDFLIKEEAEHLKFFEERLDEVKQEKETGFEEDDLLSSMDYGIFQPFQNMEELEHIISDMKKALHLGIAVENKSIQFYEICKDNVAQDGAKKEIANIIEEEKRHKALIEGLLTNI